MNEPRFLMLDEVLRIHDRSLAEHGGSAGPKPPTWEIYSAMIDVAEKKKTKADLAEIFRRSAGQ